MLQEDKKVMNIIKVKKRIRTRFYGFVKEYAFCLFFTEYLAVLDLVSLGLIENTLGVMMRGKEKAPVGIVIWLPGFAKSTPGVAVPE